jgi:hypothetical protein
MGRTGGLPRARRHPVSALPRPSAPRSRHPLLHAARSSRPGGGASNIIISVADARQPRAGGARTPPNAPGAGGADVTTAALRPDRTARPGARWTTAMRAGERRGRRAKGKAGRLRFSFGLRYCDFRQKWHHIEPNFEIADVRVTECGIAALGKVSRIEASDQAKVHVSRAPKMLTPL